MDDPLPSTAGVCQRIHRGAYAALIVDADDGVGRARSVVRTVRE